MVAVQTPGSGGARRRVNPKFPVNMSQSECGEGSYSAEPGVWPSLVPLVSANTRKRLILTRPASALGAHSGDVITMRS
jgi:hypothetical protein